jgi:outer membrane protein assembly factor BamD (BamD/ComL family)
VAKGPEPAVVTDAELEKESRHNLEVARHYFKQKKAYYASYKRADEMIAGHPEFSRLDEALYIAAMSGLYLADGKGKQKVPQLTPEEAEEFKPEVLRRTARAHLARLVRDYPASKFRKEAGEALAALGGPASAEN